MLSSKTNDFSLLQVEAFHLDYLSKLLDVKDNIKKMPLLHHMVPMVMEHYPKSTDLHSDFSSLHKVAKVRMETFTMFLLKYLNQPPGNSFSVLFIYKWICKAEMNGCVLQCLAFCTFAQSLSRCCGPNCLSDVYIGIANRLPFLDVLV